MKIIRAEKRNLEIVKEITQETILRIYPKYYPQGAVAFFAKHHNEENILKDIEAKRVFLLLDDKDAFVGTVTIKENEICRLFVLPKNQSKGYGTLLLDFAEEEILKKYNSITLDASLSAKNIYLHRNYVEVEYHIIETDNGDKLCYDVMKKREL